MLFRARGGTIGSVITQAESRILDALLELERAVAQMPSANPKPDLTPLFSRIDALARELPRNSEPDLLHYLHRKSYQKARMHLQERQSV